MALLLLSEVLVFARKIMEGSASAQTLTEWKAITRSVQDNEIWYFFITQDF